MSLWNNYFNQIHSIYRNNYKTKTFIIQKDMWFPDTTSRIVDHVGIIDCSEVYKVKDLATLFTDSEVNQKMNDLTMVNYIQDLFGALGIETTLGRGFSSKAVYAENFIRNFFFECHGSGANATFYLVYKLTQYLNYCDRDESVQPRVIINNYENFLHHLSARAWIKMMDKIENLNCCALCNNYELFDLGLFFDDAEPWRHFYVVDDLVINNIIQYKPDLKKAHNIEKMLREGVFGNSYKVE